MLQPDYKIFEMNKRLQQRTDDSDNLWWDAFANEFFEDEAQLTLTFCLEDGPKRYSKKFFIFCFDHKRLTLGLQLLAGLSYHGSFEAFSRVVLRTCTGSCAMPKSHSTRRWSRWTATRPPWSPSTGSPCSPK